MPRHLQLHCDRYLCERMMPGNRVLVLGIYSIKKVAKTGGRTGGKKKLVGLRVPYFQVVGISVDGENTGSGKLVSAINFFYDTVSYCKRFIAPL